MKKTKMFVVLATLILGIIAFGATVESLYAYDCPSHGCCGVQGCTVGCASWDDGCACFMDGYAIITLCNLPES